MRITSWIAIIVAFCLFLGFSAVLAETRPPMQTLKERIDQIIAVLNDPQYHPPARKEAQRDKSWEIASPMFDFMEISRRTVGSNWGKFTEEEKERFTEIFTRFLGNSYIDKMQGEYHNEQIVYVKEIALGHRLHDPKIEFVVEKEHRPVDGLQGIRHRVE